VAEQVLDEGGAIRFESVVIGKGVIWTRGWWRRCNTLRYKSVAIYRVHCLSLLSCYTEILLPCLCCGVKGMTFVMRPASVIVSRQGTSPTMHRWMN